MDFRVRPYSKRSRKYIYEQNQQQIIDLQRNGDRLLQIIKIQETEMNRKTQLKQEPYEYDLYWLRHLTENMLRIISLIETYKYFQAKNEVVTRENYTWFYEISTSYYLHLTETFNRRLKNVNDNNIDNDIDIDFVIAK